MQKTEPLYRVNDTVRISSEGSVVKVIPPYGNAFDPGPDYISVQVVLKSGSRVSVREEDIAELICRPETQNETLSRYQEGLQKLKTIGDIKVEEMVTRLLSGEQIE
jgi:hypothetical protein